MNRNTCGILFKRIHDGIEKKVNNNLKSSGLTMSQMVTLFTLSSHPKKEMTLKELEHAINVAQSTAAGIVCRLEQKGFVSSYGQEGDKRIKNIRITESGENCCRNSSKDMDDLEKEILKNLTEEEQEQLLDLLLRVCRNL